MAKKKANKVKTVLCYPGDPDLELKGARELLFVGQGNSQNTILIHRGGLHLIISQCAVDGTVLDDLEPEWVSLLDKMVSTLNKHFQEDHRDNG